MNIDAKKLQRLIEMSDAMHKKYVEHCQTFGLETTWTEPKDVDIQAQLTLWDLRLCAVNTNPKASLQEMMTVTKAVILEMKAPPARNATMLHEAFGPRMKLANKLRAPPPK